MVARKKKKKKKLRRYFYYFLFLVLSFVGFIIWLGFGQAKLGVDIPKYYDVRGIDVSHHNGKVNWEQVADEGISFAYIKLTEGVSHVDRYAMRNLDFAKQNNIKVGGYHFFTFKKDGVEQAKFFLSKLNVKDFDLPPALDVEYSKINKKSYHKLVNESVVRNIVLFDSVVNATIGKHVVIYTNKECYEDLIRDRFDNDLWICNLTEEPECARYPNWVLWQHSHTGELDGIASNVDLNVYHLSRSHFEDWIK